MTGKLNIDRSLKRMAKKHVAEARKAFKSLRANQTAMSKTSVLTATVECQLVLEYLATLIKESCLYCGKKVEFGYNSCASCADERGP